MNGQGNISASKLIFCILNWGENTSVFLEIN